MGYEVLFSWCKLLPVCNVSGEVNLLGSTKRCFSLFVHLPDVGVLNGEDDQAMGVWEEEGFWGMSSFELSNFVG
jgi:hypothetical protein